MHKKNTRIGFAAGVVLIVLFSLLATWMAGFDVVKQLNFSPLIVGIILGMIFANTLRRFVPASWGAGINFCSKQILRLGIIFFGFKVTLGQVMDVGLAAVLVDALVVCLTLCLGVFVGRYLLKMDGHTTLLTTIGSSICGAAAVLGAEPVVKGEAHKTAVAVSTVVIFGTIAMFLYPSLYRAGVYDMSDREVAVYTGATMHEVAHAVGAGNAIDSIAAARKAEATQAEGAEEVAKADASAQESAAAAPEAGVIEKESVIVKMIRVMMLAPVLIVLSMLLSRRRKGADGKSGKIQVPAFAFLFLVVIGINSLDLLPAAALGAVQTADAFMLTMAMTALGVETSFDKFLKAGPKPFLLAMLLFAWLVFGGYWMVKIVCGLLG